MSQIKMSEKEYQEFLAKEAKERKARGQAAAPAKGQGQNIRTNYQPSSPVYANQGTGPIPRNQQTQRDIRAQARAQQKPSTVNTLRKIGVTVVGFIGKGNSAVQGAGKRYIDAEDREVPARRRAAQNDLDRARANIGSPRGSSWAEHSTPTRKSVPAPRKIDGNNFGLPSTLPKSIFGNNPFGGDYQNVAGFGGLPNTLTPAIPGRSTLPKKKKKGKK
jgi:hypothetical protein